MSEYKKHLNKLQTELEGYKYFNDEKLELLKTSIDLSIVYNELFTRAIKFKNTDKYQELIGMVDAIGKAKDGYDKLYSRYHLATLALETHRIEALKLCEYTRDLEKQVKAINDL